MSASRSESAEAEPIESAGDTSSRIMNAALQRAAVWPVPAEGRWRLSAAARGLPMPSTQPVSFQQQKRDNPLFATEIHQAVTGPKGPNPHHIPERTPP